MTRQQPPAAAPPPMPPPPPVAAPAAAAPPPAPAAGDMSDQLALLAQLGELKAAGVLTEHEFEAKKAKILLGS